LSRRSGRYVLAYDASCGACSRFRAAVEFLDARRRIEFIPLDAADGSGMLSGVEPASRYSSFHLVCSVSGSPAGDAVWSGSEAILPLARLLSPFGRAESLAAEDVPGSGAMVSFVYNALSRLHRACSLEPSVVLQAGSSSRKRGLP
jgi:predicted DCC family thiol-disulfide oxidoreductase YuxK